MDVSRKDECSLDSCTDKIIAKGLCWKHYQRRRRTGTTELPRPEHILLDVSDGCGHCKACDRVVPVLDKFGGGYRCFAQGRLSYVYSKYSLRPNVFWDMFYNQDGSCAICALGFEPFTLAEVDHDHACCDADVSCGGCVRGLLCHACNTGLAAFRDSTQSLGAALAYLIK